MEERMDRRELEKVRKLAVVFKSKDGKRME